MIPGLFTLLTTNAELSALVGTHVYPMVLPNNTSALPAITLQIVAGKVTAGLNTRGTQRQRLQVDVWASTYQAADQVRDAIVDVLHG